MCWGWVRSGLVVGEVCAGCGKVWAMWGLSGQVWIGHM